MGRRHISHFSLARMKSTFLYEMFFLWMIPMLALGSAVPLPGHCPPYAIYYCSCSENDVADLKPIKLCPYLKEYFTACIPCPAFQQSQIQCSCPLDECLICSAQQFGSETYIKNRQAYGTNYTTPRLGFIKFIKEENRFPFSQNLKNKPKTNLSYCQLKVLEAFRNKQKYNNAALKEIISLLDDEHAEQNMTLKRQYIRPKTGDKSYFGQDILPNIQDLRIRRQNRGSNNEEFEVKSVKKSRSKQDIEISESYMNKNDIQPEAGTYFVLMPILMVPQVYGSFEKFNKNASEIMNNKKKTNMLGRPGKLPIKTVNPLNFLVVEPSKSEHEKDITSFGRFVDSEKSTNKKNVDNEKKWEFDTTKATEYQRQNFYGISKNVNEIPERSEFKEINRNKNDSISLHGERAITNLQLLIDRLLGNIGNSQDARYKSNSKMSTYEKEIIDENFTNDDKNMIYGSPIGEKDFNAEELMMNEEDMIDVIRKLVEEDMFIFSKDSIATKFGKIGNSEKTHSESKKISKRFLGNETHPMNYIFNQSEIKIWDLPVVSNDYDGIILNGELIGRRLLQSSETNVDDDDDLKIKELFLNDTGYRDIAEKLPTRHKTEDENMTEENSTANEKDIIDEEIIIHENRTIEDESKKISRRFLGNETNAMNYNFNQSEDKIRVLLAVTNGYEYDILNTTFIGRRLLQSSETTDDDDFKKNGMFQRDTAYKDNVEQFPTRDHIFNKSEAEIQALSKVTNEYEKKMPNNGIFIRREFFQSNKTNEDKVVVSFSLNDTFLNTRRKRSTLPENNWCSVNLKRKNGYLDCTIWTYKKECTLDCHEGYALNGQKKVTFKCQRKDNKFAPEITACSPTDAPRGKPNPTEYGQDYDQNRFPEYAEEYDESEYAEQSDGQPEIYEDQDYGEYENPNQQGVQPDDVEYYGHGDAYDTGPQYNPGEPEYYENGEYDVDYHTK